MKNILALVAAAPAVGYNSTNAGRKFYISSVPVPDDVDAAGFAALTWVQVKAVGNLGETGSSTNIVSYDTWDTKVTLKGKGITNAGDPELEVRYIADDAGQVLMRSAAAGNFNWGFKIEDTDRPNADVDSKPTIRYNRGLVTGPRNPNGRNEDFVLDIFSLALQQEQIIVPAFDGTAP